MICPECQAPFEGAHFSDCKVATGMIEVGKCYCGASYYKPSNIGQPCEIQYCRGIVELSPKYSQSSASKE